MSRTLPLILVAACLLALVVALLFSSEAPTATVAAADADSGGAVGATEIGSQEQPSRSPRRRSGATRDHAPPGWRDDTKFLAGLGGLRGRFVDEDGAPLAGITVELESTERDHTLRGPEQKIERKPWESAATKTDANGVFRFERIVCHASMHLQAGIRTTHPYRSDAENPPVPAVRAGQVTDMGDIVVPPGGALTGRVLRPDGRPYAGATVHLTELDAASSDPEIYTNPAWMRIQGTGVEQIIVEGYPRIGQTWSTYTDADGRYRFDNLLPGSAAVAVSEPGVRLPFRFTTKVKSAEETEAETVRLAAGHTIRGRVVDAHGDPVPHAEVVVCSRAGGSNDGTSFESTSADGTFSIRGFPNDKVTVGARRPGGIWHVRTEVDAAEVQDIALPDPVTATFRLVGLPADAAAPIVSLVALGDTRGPMAIPDDADGSIDLSTRLSFLGRDQFTISGVAAGTYSLSVRVGRLGNDSQIQIRGNLDPQEVVLAPLIEISVTVVDDRDRAVARAEVQERGRFLGWTDECGQLIASRRSGMVTIAANHPGFRPGEVEVGEHATATRIVLERRCIVHGRVRVPAGTPRFELWGLEVAVGDEHMGIELAVDGTFYIPIGSAGAYRVTEVTDELGRHTTVRVAGTGDTSFAVHHGTNPPLFLDAEWTIPAPTGRVHGRVILDGAPARGFVVQNHDAKPMETASVRTDRNGAFDLGTVHGRSIDLAVTAADDEHEDRLFTAEGTPGERPIELLLHTGSVSGSLVHADGKPARNMRVRFYGVLDVPWSGTRPSSWYTRETDDKGAFSIPRITCGTYLVRVDGESERVALEGVTVVRGVESELQLRLSRTAGFAVQLDYSTICAAAETRLVFLGPVTERASQQGMSFVGIDLLPGEYTLALELRGSEDAPWLRLEHPEKLHLARGSNALEERRVVFGSNLRPALKARAHKAGFDDVASFLRSFGLKPAEERNR